jgi:hypothetical protein
MANGSQQPARAYSAAHFALELGEKEVVGFFRSVDGGGIKSEITTYQSGPSTVIWRQLGKPKYEDLKIQVGMAMSKTFYTWIEQFFAGEVVRKNGAIVAGDFLFKERARRVFKDALISSLDFPKLDATDKNACFMTVTITPETVRFVKGSGEPMDSQNAGVNQKLWTSANFAFSIDGFQEACARVTKIDGFSIKQKIHEYRAGNLRDPVRVPGILEMPNLTFYLPEVDAQPFIDHFTKHVVNGAPQTSPRLNGTIEMRDNLGMTLCEITLKGVDIAALAPDKSDATSEEIKQVKVEISVEEMKFDYAD